MIHKQGKRTIQNGKERLLIHTFIRSSFYLNRPLIVLCTVVRWSSWSVMVLTMFSLPEIIQYTISVASFFGIFFNLLLMPLIFIKSSGSIGSYKFLLLCYSAVAMINSVADFLTVPIFQPEAENFVFYSTVQRLPRESGSYVICLFSATYINLVIILMYSFIYRYFAMCRPDALIWFHETKRLLLLAFIFLGLFLLCAAPLFLYTYQNPIVEVNVPIVSEGIFNLRLAEISYIGVPMFDNGELQWKTVGLITLWCTVFFTSFSVSAWCSYRMLKQLRDLTGMTSRLSSHSKALHKQLLILLGYQTLLPMSLEFIPIMASYFFAFLGYPIPAFYFTITSIFLPLSKFLDPILIITMVPEYRKTIWRLFEKKNATRNVTDYSLSVRVTNA